MPQGRKCEHGNSARYPSDCGCFPTEQQRTAQQNKSLHLLFTQISNHCIETGIDQKALVTALKGYNVPTSPQAIKEIWRAIQIAITGKTSTKDLDRKEIDQVYDAFNKFISEVTHEHFSFPSFQELMLQQLENEALR